MQPTTPSRYKVDSQIGEGGMAHVWLARQQGPVGFEKLVVLKMVLPHLARSERFLTMFKDEARIAADLRHPNVVQLLDAGIDENGSFMALELLDGVDGARLLRSFRQAGEQMPLEVALPIVIDAAHGLAYVHDKVDLAGTALGIVHRDISPSNLFVTLAGVTKVLDFGVAHARNQLTVTEAGVLKGKTPYMSPEQILGDPVDHRSDQFALAIVALELLTGSRLFERENDIATLHAILEGDATVHEQVAAAAPPLVAAVITRALSFDRERRFPNTLAFAEALEDAAEGAGMLSGRGALRRAVARAVPMSEANAYAVTAPSAHIPRLRDVDADENQAEDASEGATSIVRTPVPAGDEAWARQRAADLAEELWNVVVRPVAPRSGLSDHARALCVEAGRAARCLVHLREDGARALVLAVAAEIAEVNPDPRLLEDALLLAPTAAPAVRARALELAGDRKKARGEIVAARERYEAALALSADDPAFASLVERNLADLALDERELVVAEAHGRRACALARKAGSRFAVARAIFALARVVLRRGALDGAELLLDQAARVLEQEGDERFLARVTFERALVCEARGDADLAASLLRAALAVHERLGDALFARRARENLVALDALQHAPSPR